MNREHSVIRAMESIVTVYNTDISSTVTESSNAAVPHQLEFTYTLKYAINASILAVFITASIGLTVYFCY